MARILHLSKYYYPFLGGLEEVVRNFCLAQVEQGHQTRVLCSKNNPDQPNFQCHENVEIHRLNSLGIIASQPIVLGYLTSLRDHIDWADLVYVHAPNPICEVGVLLDSTSEYKKIVIVHHSDIVKQKFLGAIFSPLQRLGYSRASAIIVASSNHVNFSKICSHFSSKCCVIPFGLHDRLDSSVTIKYENYILFVGRLVSYKGIDVLLNAIAGTNLRLKIVGTGPLEASLKNLALELGIANQVEFLGQVENEQLDQLYSECRLLVLPSITNAENFGLVQIEAMMFQKPVICSRLNSGASTIVQDNETGFLVEPNNIPDLRSKLLRLNRNDGLEKQFGQASRRRFDQYFSFEALNKNLDQFHNMLSHQTGVNILAGGTIL